MGSCSVANCVIVSLLFLPLLSCAPLKAPVEDPDLYRNASELIRDRGYPLEEHYVTTPDGFILNLQRIPSGRKTSNSKSPKPVVFLQHGLTMDSTNWVLNSPSGSLGYILADRGFDVWLGNIRGNMYSQRHIKLNPSQDGFWDWSWQEMARYDLPAMLNYALNVSGQSQLFYVGHSQGTLIGFTGFSSNPELASKVKMFFALAPVYTVGHCSEVIRSAAYALYPAMHGFQNFQTGRMMTHKLVQMLTEKSLCNGGIEEKLCYDVGQELFGFDSSNINMTRMPVILSHWGSGTSFKNFVHFGQMVLSKECTKFDHGYFHNFMRYGQGKREFLVKWAGWGSEFNTWEPEEHFLNPAIIRDFEHPMLSVEEVDHFAEQLLNLVEAGLRQDLVSKFTIDFPIGAFNFFFRNKGQEHSRGTWALNKEDFSLCKFSRGWDRAWVNARGTERELLFPILLRPFLSRSTQLYHADGSKRQRRWIQRLSISFRKHTV